MRIDTRRTLPISDAERFLSARYAWWNGDEGGNDGVRLGRCHQRRARTISCELRGFRFSEYFISDPPGFWGKARSPAGSATAVLRRDGIHARRTFLPGQDLWKRNYLVHLSAPTRRRLATSATIPFRIGSRRAAQARLSVRIWWTEPRGAREQTLILDHRLAPRTAWNPVISLPHAALLAALAHHKAHATITLTTNFANRHGPDYEQHGLRTELIP